MKSIIIFLSLLSFFFSVSSFAKMKKVKKGKDGMYWAKYDAEGIAIFIYHVDTISQNCYAILNPRAGSGAITDILCKKLVKRPEWKSIITWTN